MSFLAGQETIEKKDRSNKPSAGQHVVIIDCMEIVKTREHGNCPKLSYMIESSSAEKPGVECGELFFVNTGTEMQKKYTRGDLLQVGRAIATALGYDGGATEQVIQIVDALYSNPQYVERQPARGLKLSCVSVNAKTSKGNDVINTRYEAIAQTKEEVLANRALIERWRLSKAPALNQALAPVAAPAPVAPQMPAQAPAPQFVTPQTHPAFAPPVQPAPAPAAAPDLFGRLLS